MKPRIRHIHLSDLAGRSRLLHGARYNSSSSTSTASSSTSTSSSTRKPWPRQTDFADEWRDQTVAPDALLSSTSDGSSSKPFRPSFARRGPASHIEEPVLKKNPWVDQYKIKDESHLDDADAAPAARVVQDQNRTSTDGFDVNDIVAKLQERFGGSHTKRHDKKQQEEGDLDRKRGGN
jgi:hypothetical protein